MAYLKRWGTLAEALALVCEEELVTAGRNGDVHGRIIHHYRPPRPLPPEYWNGNLDLERSRILPCMWIEFDTRGQEHMSIPDGWVRAEIDLQSVREHFGLDQQTSPPRPEETRGAKGKYDWEGAGLELLGKIHRSEIPEPTELSEVVQLYTSWFAEKDQWPSKTMLYEHAERLFIEIS